MKYRATAIPFVTMCALVFCCKENTKSTPQITTATPNLIHLSSEEGTKWDVLGSRITGKILSEDTRGEYAVIITETPPNGGPPKHIHTHEDELFYVIQGNYEFTYSDTLINAKQGDIVHLPKGKPHSFKNIDTIAGITMNTITPGGFESFFADISSLADRNLLGKKQIDSLSDVYGLRFVKPKGK